MEPSAALPTREAAAFVGLGQTTWAKLWRGRKAPQPSSRGRAQTWSADELRAWIANGQPDLKAWEPIWARMLDEGTWRGGRCA